MRRYASRTITLKVTCDTLRPAGSQQDGRQGRWLHGSRASHLAWRCHHGSQHHGPTPALTLAVKEAGRYAGLQGPALSCPVHKESDHKASSTWAEMAGVGGGAWTDSTVRLSRGLDAVPSHLDTMALNCGPVPPTSLHGHTGWSTRTVGSRRWPAELWL